jgi:hypothetical protein
MSAGQAAVIRKAAGFNARDPPMSTVDRRSVDRVCCAS